MFATFGVMITTIDCKQSSAGYVYSSFMLGPIEKSMTFPKILTRKEKPFGNSPISSCVYVSVYMEREARIE